MKRAVLSMLLLAFFAMTALSQR
jgi:DnaJ-related protein SCJ1